MHHIYTSDLHFGTPVGLVTTTDTKGNDDIEVAHCSWSLRGEVVLPLDASSRAVENLRSLAELVINLPSAAMGARVKHLVDRNTKRGDAFDMSLATGGVAGEPTRSGFTRRRSETVLPPRIVECQIQMEAIVAAMFEVKGAPDSFAMLVAHVVALHVHTDIVDSESHTVDPCRWSPLLYSFGEYRSVGAELGRMVRRVRT